MNLEVRKAKTGDLPEVKRLVDEYISVDYYSEEELAGMFCGEQHLFYVVTDADRDGAVVAYFYAFLSTLDEVLPLLHVSEKPEGLLRYSGDTLVGVYKTTSTEKEYRKLGLCTAFIRDLEPVLRERGAKLIVTTALRPLGRKAPVRHILHDRGFTPIAEISRPWVNVMTQYCPYCKQTRCICDAVFYIKELNEGEEDDRCE